MCTIFWRHLSPWRLYSWNKILATNTQKEKNLLLHQNLNELLSNSIWSYKLFQLVQEMISDNINLYMLNILQYRLWQIVRNSQYYTQMGGTLIVIIRGDRLIASNPPHTKAGSHMQEWISNLESTHNFSTTHFLSHRFRLRLNHFFFVDLPFECDLPSSTRLLDFKSSPRDMLLLPLPKGLLPLAFGTDLATVKEEWILSRLFSSSSTCSRKAQNDKQRSKYQRQRLPRNC